MRVLKASCRRRILNHMVEYRAASLDGVFRALADPTRRAILERLAQQPARVTDIAREFPVSLNGISKHLIVLERAGLIRREILGREHICALYGPQLQEAMTWINQIRAFWEVRLDAFERHVLAKRRKRNE
jgi:DNA-binding transcriptional ArsR family regulator